MKLTKKERLDLYRKSLLSSELYLCTRIQQSKESLIKNYYNSKFCSKEGNTFQKYLLRKLPELNFMSDPDRYNIQWYDFGDYGSRLNVLLFCILLTEEKL